MKNKLFPNAKNTLPYFGFSALTGCLSALLGTAFKLGAEGVIHLSGTLYAAARQAPLWLPVLIIGAALLGLAASFIVSRFHSCKGGGIPTSVAAVRGMFTFRWLPSIFVLPFSALLTFFSGVPLGTEGPCVQMGTAIGDGVIQCCGAEKHKPWRRYVMTGGASAGFSVATASPLAAIVFSVEELHRHFSPLLLAGVSVSVMTAQITVQLLSFFGLGSGSLFHIPVLNAIDPRFLFVPVLIGTLCGLCSVLFTRFYHIVETVMRSILKKRSVTTVFPLLFALMALLGFVLPDAPGTGHALVEKLLDTQVLWYLLLLIFFLRAVFMMAANTAGATGGVFLPTIAFGAIIGALCAKGMIALGWIDASHSPLMVVLGITAFLGATSRIPLTACVFAVEALGGIHNAPAIIIAATAAFLTVEISGVKDLTDTVIEAKLHSIRKGTKPMIAETTFTVEENSFAAGKELCDILWPDACRVVSFEAAPESHHSVGIQAGDRITVRYQTCTPEATARELIALAGTPAGQKESCS